VSTTPDSSAKLEEFKALRAEIDRRSNAQQAIVGAELVAVTALTSLALSRANNVGVLLILPVVSLFLAVQWYDHRLTIRSIGEYVGDEMGAFGKWEKKGKPPAWGKYWGLVATLGLFPAVSGGAVLALLVTGLSRSKNPSWAIAWWWIDAVATLIQITMVRHLAVNTGSRPKGSAICAAVKAFGVWGPR
jgi:cobalamin synthase